MSVEDFEEAVRRKREQEAEAWSEPTPLYAEHEKPEPYPLDALPPLLRHAVSTYQAFGQQPVELIACSALATASLACQGLANVSRDGNLAGPCSLSFITVAVSGERKTSADTRMRRAATEWQAEKRREQAPMIAAAKRRLEIHEARCDGLLGRIKRLSSSMKSEDEMEREQLGSKLLALETERPKVPPEICLFHEDTSPEQLAIDLARGWPSASLWSDEGGLIVGSHAMSEHAALRFLTLLNRLWDANEFDRRRVTRECATVRGRRFSVSIMLQPTALGTLLTTGNGLARGVGALARCLVAWPTSTIGARSYKAGNLNAPALQAFDDRIRALLDTPLPLDEDGGLDPPTLKLAPLAFEVWRRLHDTIEAEISLRGEFSLLPDFGAKIADQAARLACVMHVIDQGPHGEIQHQTLHAAARLALWHLHEARRVLDMIGHSCKTTEAQLLLDWLREQAEPPWIGTIIQAGPARIRNKARRDAAIAVLTEHGLARLETKEKRQHLVVNPNIPGSKP